MTQQLKNRLAEEHNNERDKKLEKINNHEETPWKIAKGLQNKNNANIPPIKNSATSTLAISDSNKAEAFAESLEKQFTENATNDPTFENNITQETNSVIATPENYKFTRVTTEEINQIIKNLKQRKAPRLDKIDNKILKNLPEEAIKYITKICNSILKLRHFPNNWKTSKIFLIRKQN